MTIAIIGATGQLGSDTIDALLERGASPADILALGRNPGRLEALAARGLRAGIVDLTDTQSTRAALSGVGTLLLISVGTPGDGLAPRTLAVDAAARAGVERIVYTSALNAPTTTLFLAAEHKATEDVITASGIPATFLRNGWYTENLQQDFETARLRGVVTNSVADGRLATASRRDYAEAAAVVLTSAGHEGAAYELSGDTAWNYTEFAESAQQVLGTPVRYEPLTPEQERDVLRAAGIDEGTAGFIVSLNENMRDNTLAAVSGQLRQLIGRDTTPLVRIQQTWRATRDSRRRRPRSLKER